jgi:malonate transporter and related proteins
LTLNILRPPIPAPLMSFADILGRASLAAGLLVVGAGLDLSRLRRPGVALLLACALKLVVLPVLAACVARLLGVAGTGLAVTILCTAVPTASGSYMLARQMGGDSPLMAEILTVQTLLAMVTLPFALALLA